MDWTSRGLVFAVWPRFLVFLYRARRGGRSRLRSGAGRGRTLGQAHVFEILIENLPARAARKNFQRFACLRAASEKIYECVRSAHTRDTLGQKRQRHAENAAREAEEEAASVRAEAAAAQSQLRKATAYATSLSAARAVADEKARKLREAADRLAPPKSD